MPNPNDPEQAECRRCHDTGIVPGTDRLCSCTGVQIKGVLTHRVLGSPSNPDHPFTAQLSVIDGAPTKVCGIRTDGGLCHRREEDHS